MSRFSGYGKRFALSIIAAAFLLTLAASPAAAEQPRKAESSCLSSLKDVVKVLLDVLVQSDKAFRPLNDPNQSMLIRVVDADGKPIAGAIVRSEKLIHALDGHGWTTHTADNFDNPFFPITISPCTTTKADGTGRAIRPAAKNEGVQVSVHAVGYVPLLARWNEDDGRLEPIPAEFTFKLEKSRSIGGVVLDASGRPAVEATVSLSINDNNTAERVQPAIDMYPERTDEQGRWRCNHLPAHFEGLRICVDHSGVPPLDLGPEECKAQFDKLQSLSAVFTLEKPYTIQGKVTDMQGTPVPSAKVSIMQSSGSSMQRSDVTTTDADGKYSFDKTRVGSCEIFVSGSRVIYQHRTIDVTPHLASVDFQLKPGRTVRIHVVDSKGKSVAGAEISSSTVRFGAPDQELPPVPGMVVTDANGRWATAGEPEGKLSLSISKTGYMTVNRELAADDKEQVITLRPTIRISGRIINVSTRKPIRKAYASCVSKLLPSKKRSDLCCEPPVILDGEGHYEMTFNDDRGIDALAWQIEVLAPGYVATKSRKYETREGSQTIDIEMLPGPSVSGIVRGPDGKPVADAKVFISTAANPVHVENGRVKEDDASLLIMDQTKADGRFELPLPLEPYLVGVVHSSGGAEITARALESQNEIVLQPWARVEGFVQKPADQPASCEESVELGVNHVDGVSTFITKGKSESPAIEWTYSCQLNRSRHFAIERVLPGRAEIHADRSCQIEGGGISLEWPWRTQNFTTCSGQTSYIEFIRRGRPVTGSIAMPANAPRKLAPVGGYGNLIFQRPFVPLPAEIAKQPADVRRKWERQWLQSETGQAADRAGQDYSFALAADGKFKVKDVGPGVYQVAVNLRRAGKTPDQSGDDVAWFFEDMTIPPAATDKSLDLGKHVANTVNLLAGDAAPDFEFQTADGRMHRLAEYRGRKMVVVFTEKWDPIMERFGDGGDAEAELNPETLAMVFVKGPFVWINVSSDTGPRPPIKIATGGQGQFVQGYLPPKADAWRAYDVHGPRRMVEAYIARDGKVLRK